MADNDQNLVITRPLNQADSLLKSLNTDLICKGKIVVTHYPLVKIKALKLSQPLEQFSFDGVIFISPNAVIHAVGLLSNEDWQNLSKAPLFAVGSSTAETLEKFTNGATIHIPKKMNSEGLLGMSDLCTVKNQSWLIVKGVGGRKKLKDTLCERGANVHEFCTYERLQPNNHKIEKIASLLKANAIWIVTSLYAIKNLNHILKESQQNCRIIVSSDRIKKLAVDLGFDVIAVANDATDKQLMNCIRELRL